MSVRFVYHFGAGTAEGDGTMKDVLGGKGAGLAEMSRAGIPVPPGFTLSTAVCRQFHREGRVPADIEAEMVAALAVLEQGTGRRLGDPTNPLLLSVRSGAKFSMPGMMNTILNLGLNPATVAGLAAQTGNPRFAQDCYRRFLQMFGAVALGVDAGRFEALLAARKAARAVVADTELETEDFAALADQFAALIERETGRPVPEDPLEQLRLARDAVFRSWWSPRASYYRQLEGIPDDLGTAANVQVMVFGNLGAHSASGVGFTRDPATGAKTLFGEFLINAQGEDVVSGVRTPHPLAELAAVFPQAHAELVEIAGRLEALYRDVQDFEFTVEDGRLYMLQTRNGKRTGRAAVKIALDLLDEGQIEPHTAVMRVSPEQLEQLLHPELDPESIGQLTALVHGIAASPGAAVGRAAFTADAAVAMAKTGPVILVRGETTSDDIHGMDAARGFLTAVGGASSHAAVVARGMGRPCITGAGALTIDEVAGVARVAAGGKELVVRAGDWVSLDGTRGVAYLGRAVTRDPDLRAPELARFLALADGFRGRFGVRANADTPLDAQRARELGAEGIGLCRTEHMFFAAERLPLMRAMILARDESSRREALARLLPMQRQDFVALFEAMDGFPVVIRTLDPPLHEFLPARDELRVDLARLPTLTGADAAALATRYGLAGTAPEALAVALEAVFVRVEELSEVNPMLGHRGCRLGITYPEITEMQARAVAEAALDVSRRGVTVRPEVMIPLVGNVAELRHQKAIVARVLAEVLGASGLQVPIGTMIEIPRAALTADEIATEAEFFSFGTNDLTQTTFGMSRDDYGKFAPRYRELGIFRQDPFAVLDTAGVGRLMEQAVRRGRATRPNLEIGVCGEHGGEPKSVAFCIELGLDYVSCSPFRVPVARLAAAQAFARQSSAEAVAELQRTA